MNPDKTILESEIRKLLNLDCSRAVADLIVDAIEKHPELFGPLMHMSFSMPYPAGMRAARAIQLYCDHTPEAILPYLEEVVSQVLKSKIEGVRRNYLKIIADKIEPEILAEPGLLISRCFDWLLDPAVMPATRVYSAEIIAKFCIKEPALKHELIESLSFALEECPISLRTRGKKIIKRLNRLNHPISDF